MTPFAGELQLSTPSGSDVFQVPDNGLVANPVVADFDGNGQLDYAALVNAGSNAVVYVFYNGRFGQPSTLTLPGGGVVKMVAGNFLGNGRPDLAVLGMDGTVYILPNQGGVIGNAYVATTLPGKVTYHDLAAGTFYHTATDRSHLVALFQDDNLNSGLFTFYINSPGPTEVTGLAEGLTNLAAGDINGDGLTDLFAGNEFLGGHPVVLYADGTGKFTATTMSSLGPGPTAVGDINGDGLLDLGVISDQVGYAIQGPVGTFTAISTAIPQGAGGFTASDVVLCDVNGDSRPDLVWLESDGVNAGASLWVALNSGTPNNWFTPAQVTSWTLAGNNALDFGAQLATGDIDGNGLLDVVVTDAGENNIVELVHNRTTFQQPPLPVQVQTAQNPTGLDFVNAQRPLPHFQDLGFESPQAPFASPPATDPLYWYNPSGSPWTFTGSAGLASNGSAFNSLQGDAPEGSQVAFLQQQGSFSQSIYFPAGSYSISFLAAQRADNNQTFQVEVDGNVVGTFTPVDAGYRPYATDGFPVTAGYHTVTFVGMIPAPADNSAFIDLVTLQLLPSVADYGFETPPVGSDSGAFAYRPIGSPWTFTDSAGVAGNGGAFTGGNPAAPEGSQVAFLQEQGTLSQSIYFPAGIYSLSFQAAQRRNVASSQTFRVEVDGAVVGTFTPSGTNYQSYATDGFPVTAGYHTITFVGLNPAGGDNTAFIDAVSIQLFRGLLDGGFEAPAAPFAAPPASDPSDWYDPNGSPWTFISGSIPGNGAGVAANGSSFTSGNPSAPEGNQVAFLQRRGSFSQEVYFPAGTYTISFLAAQRAGQASSQTVEVLIDYIALKDTITPTATSYQSYTTDKFTVTAGLHTIAFAGLDPSNDDNTAFIDAISIQVPPKTDLTLTRPPKPSGGDHTVGGGDQVVHVTPPTADPVLAQVTMQRSQRGRLMGATLIFNVPVDLDPNALRLVHRKRGRAVQNMSRGIQIIMGVQDGRTWVQLRLRSPRGKLLARGRYSLFIDNDLVRNTMTGVPLRGSAGSSQTEIQFSA
jgi:hypothetical protein